MMERNISNSVQSAMRLSASMANADNHTSYGISHLVLALLSEGTGTGLSNILSSMNKDVGYIHEWFDVRREMYVSEEHEGDGIVADSQVTLVLEEAERSKIKLGSDSIDALCVFTAIIRQGVVFSDSQIESLSVSENDVLSFFNAQAVNHFYQGEENKLLASFPFAYNLKEEAYILRGRIVLGREKEVRTILEGLERCANKAIMLIGDSGVGKTAIIHSLVKEVCENHDELISQIKLIGLHTAKLLASSGNETELAQKISYFLGKLDEMEGQTVLLIDDLQMLLEFGGQTKSTTLINIFNSQISDGSTSIVFTITPDAFRKHIEKNSIESKLDILDISELDKFTVLSMLREHSNRMEEHYGLSISDNATQESLTLSSRYFKEKKQPAAAIDLLDATAAAVRLSNKNSLNELDVFLSKFESLKQEDPNRQQQDLRLFSNSLRSKISVVLISKLPNGISFSEGTLEEELAKTSETLRNLSVLAENGIPRVSPSEVEAVVAEMTGIPLGKIQAQEKDRLLGIESRLEERVKGQNKAITTLSDAIIESRSGLSDPRKPIGSFFFLGPTGTGKTELAKSLAELLFDDENAMIRFDMSEFKEEHSAALLYGAPPGYVGYEEGGLLVTKIRQKPYSVILFDEIEKAHSSVYDVFLQIMDEGKIHDKLGREGDFSNAIIIFTSNIASSWIAEQFNQGITPDSKHLTEVMSQHFRPEFLGRLTEVVPFAPINETVAQSIFRLHFSRLQQQLQEQKNIHIQITDEALRFLSAKGYSPQYGARPIAGVVRTYLKKSISRLIVSEGIKEGDSVKVYYRDNGLEWKRLDI